MRCRSAQRLMFLFREGDLSPARAAALHEHYASCEECARRARRIAAELAPLEALRLFQPVLDEPRVLTTGILRGIEAGHPTVSHAGFPVRSLGRLLSLARRTAGAATAAMALVYALLSYNDARAVASLERHLSEQKRDAGGTAEALARDAAALLEPRNGASYVESGISPDDVGKVLSYLVNPRQATARVTGEDYFLRKYPRLASITLQDGLDDRERSVLTDEGELFLKDLKKLIRKEKGTNER